jgi:transposase
MTGRKNEPEVEVLSGGAGRRRRWTAAEKVAMVRETLEPGISVSLVARRHGVNPNQLFHWRKLYQTGSLMSVAAGEPVVPASELAAATRKIRELERLLGIESHRGPFPKCPCLPTRHWVMLSNSPTPDAQQPSNNYSDLLAELGFARARFSLLTAALSDSHRGQNDC